MPIPTAIESLSTTAAVNGPAGTEQRTLADDGLRQAYAFIRQMVNLASLASATTVTPPSTAKVFNVTGTTAITTIASTNSWDGREVTFIFAGILTFTHSANLALPGAANITTAANDVATLVQTGSGAWRCSNYIRSASIDFDLEARLADTSTATEGAALIGLNTSKTYPARTIGGKLRERISITDFNSAGTFAVGDETTDDAGAIQQHITDCSGNGRELFVPHPPGGSFYKIGSQLTCTFNAFTMVWATNFAIFKKFFNGDLFSVSGGEVEFVRCGIDGNGGSFTGGGIILPSGANSFRLIYARIKETADAPLRITGDAGSLMKVIGGLLQPLTVTPTGQAAIEMTSDDTGPCNRKVIGISTGGGPIMDASGVETVSIEACDGSYVTFSTTSKKVSMVGNRIQSALTNMQVSGTDHCIVGNTIASSIELMTNANNCVVRGNVTVGPEIVADSSTNTTNFCEQYEVSTTPTWAATGTAVSLGNGTLSGSYSKRAKVIDLTVNLVMGSTTTFGTGTYSWTLPFTADASREMVGDCYALDSGTAHFTGICKITAGATTMEAYFNNTGTAAGQTVPFTWANGDRITMTIRYLAA